MTVFLVRHARAGDRSQWRQPDDMRPLSPAGHGQATALADLLGGHRIERVLSSRYARCVQTVEPLAERAGVAVEESDALAEEATDTDVLALLDKVRTTDAVLCTHGNIIPVMLDAVRRNGTRFDASPHDWKKASTWVLETDASGAFVCARYLPPPA